jgi:uncharacterized protein (DUF1778 family)
MVRTMTREASDRLEFRLRPVVKRRIERAAQLERVPVGDFVRSAAEARADQVIREHDATVVPADFFQAMLVALDTPARANAALARAAARARDLVQPRD